MALQIETQAAAAAAPCCSQPLLPCLWWMTAVTGIHVSQRRFPREYSQNKCNCPGVCPGHGPKGVVVEVGWPSALQNKPSDPDAPLCLQTVRLDQPSAILCQLTLQHGMLTLHRTRLETQGIAA